MLLIDRKKLKDHLGIVGDAPVLNTVLNAIDEELRKIWREIKKDSSLCECRCPCCSCTGEARCC